MTKKKQTKTKHKDTSYIVYFALTDDLFGYTLEIFAANNLSVGQIIAQSPEHFTDDVMQQFNAEDREIFDNVNTEAAFVCKDNVYSLPRRYMFFGCDGCDAGHIAHEVMHLAKNVFQECFEADLCDNTEEIYCRFIEYYTQKIFDELKKGGVIE